MLTNMLTNMLTIAALIILSMLVTHPSMLVKVYNRGNKAWKGMMEKRKGLIINYYKLNYYKLYKRIDKDNRGFNITYNELIIMLIICIMLLFVRCSNEWNGKEIGGNVYVWNNNNVPSSSEYSIVWNNNNVASSSELFLPSLSVEVVGESTQPPMDTPPLNILSTQQISTLPAYIGRTIPNYHQIVLPADSPTITQSYHQTYTALPALSPASRHIQHYQHTYISGCSISISLKIYPTTACCSRYRRNNMEGFADIKLSDVTNCFNKYPAANLDQKMLQQIRNVADQFDAFNVTHVVTSIEMSQQISQQIRQKELSNLLIDGCDAADYIMYDGETRVGAGSFYGEKSGAMSALASSVMHTFFSNILNITSTNVPNISNITSTNVPNISNILNIPSTNRLPKLNQLHTHKGINIC